MQGHRAEPGIRLLPRFLLPPALAVAVLLAAAPAAAQPAALQDGPLDAIFTAYKAICFDNQGQGEKQAEAAASGRFGLTETTPSQDGSRRFEGATMFASVLDQPTRKYCMVAGPVAGDATAPAARRVAEPALGAPMSGEEPNEDMVMWIGKGAPGDVVIHIYLRTPAGGRAMGAFVTAVEPAK